MRGVPLQAGDAAVKWTGCAPEPVGGQGTHKGLLESLGDRRGEERRGATCINPRGSKTQRAAGQTWMAGGEERRGRNIHSRNLVYTHSNGT